MFHENIFSEPSATSSKKFQLRDQEIGSCDEKNNNNDFRNLNYPVRASRFGSS